MPTAPRLDPAAVALAVIVHRVDVQPYRGVIERVTVQKIAYFASVAGIPTGLQFTKGSFGPFASGLKSMTTRLVNNGVLAEQQSGRSFVVGPGRTYSDVEAAWQGDILRWDEAIERVVDLLLRIRTARQAEIAATVHFAATELAHDYGRAPTERQVFDMVSEWKQRHERPPTDVEVAESIRNLNMLGWLHIPVSHDLPGIEGDALLYA